MENELNLSAFNSDTWNEATMRWHFTGSEDTYYQFSANSSFYNKLKWWVSTKLFLPGYVTWKPKNLLQDSTKES